MAQANEMQDYYMAPWARYQSYGVGVLFGYVLWYCYTKYDGRLPISRVSEQAMSMKKFLLQADTRCTTTSRLPVRRPLESLSVVRRGGGFWVHII